MQNVTTKELWRKPLETVIGHMGDQASKAIFLNKDDTVRDILALFQKESIQGAPVVDGEDRSGHPNVIGFLSTFAIVRALLFITYDPTKDDTSIPSLESMNQDITAKDILDTCDNDAEETSMYFCEGTQPLSALLEPFSKGVHRIMTVTGTPGNYKFWVFSQTDLLSVLYGLSDGCKELENRRIDEIGLVKKSLWQEKNVESIYFRDSAAKAFYVLSLKGHIAAPVLNLYDEVVDTVSVSDIRNIGSAWGDLSLPIHTYLRKHGSKKGGINKNVRHPPVICPERATLHWVMSLLVLHRIHRVWIVDPINRPLGVITMSDVIRAFHDATGSQ